MRRCWLLFVAALVMGCGPPSKPQPPVKRRAALPKLTDSMAYKVYQRILQKAQTAHESIQPLNLKMLLAQQVKKVPAGCALTKASVRRVVVPRDVTWFAAEKRQPVHLAVLFLEPQGFNHCSCPDACPQESGEPTLCSLAVVGGTDGTPKLVVTEPPLRVDSTTEELSLAWSERPLGRLLLTLRFKTFYPECSGPPDRAQKSGTEAQLVGVHQGRFFEYLSVTLKNRVEDGNFVGTVEGSFSWAAPPTDNRHLLTTTMASYRKDESRRPGTGGTQLETHCSREKSLYRLDLKANKLVKVTAVEAKRLLKPSELKELLPSEKTGDSAEDCRD